MRVSQLSWLLLVLLALFTGFAGGRYWEHQLGRSPADWRIPTPPYQLSHAPLASSPYGPAVAPPGNNPNYLSPPYNPGPSAMAPQTWDPPATNAAAEPRYAPPVAAAPSMLPADMPPPKSSLTAAGKAKVESLSEIREMIGGQLGPGGPAFAKSPEAALMFEEALRTVVAEELAKPKEEELTPAGVDTPGVSSDSIPSPLGISSPDVAPTLDPPAVLNANESRSGSDTPALSPELPAVELLKTPHLVPARSEAEDVEELPAGAEELRGAARMVEEQAAQAEEAGQFERADALRLISQALWQVARSGKR